VCDVRILEAQTHRTDETLVFWRFTSKVFPHKAYFINSAFPTFALAFARSNNLEHLSLSHRLDLFNGDCPLSSFLFAFLLHHICEDFRVSLLLSIHQISWDCSILDVLRATLSIFFLMLLDGLLHLDLLFEAHLIEELRFDSS
jgi:hypothetical protein